MKKQKKLKVSKLSGTSVEAVTKTETNFKPCDFMTWLDQYLQMREGRTNIGTATREDDPEEYHSDTDELISNLINSKTRQVKKNSAMLRVLLVYEKYVNLPKIKFPIPSFKFLH